MLLSFQKLSIAILLSLLSFSLILAQAACPELVTTALNAVANNCTNLGRNEACYGFDQVQASFTNEVADDFFALPAAISPVSDLATIATSPLNTTNGTWGVAVMNLQANVPNTLPFRCRYLME